MNPKIQQRFVFKCDVPYLPYYKTTFFTFIFIRRIIVSLIFIHEGKLI